MTPKAKIQKLDFKHMDARGTIERHNQQRLKEAKANLVRKFNSLVSGSYNSASPTRFRTRLKSCNPSLKVLKYRNNSGNIEDAFTVTT